jgi:hypothetical protein
MKALKRTMAAEYSRELSAKVSAGKSHLAALGYWISGRPSYGLRRMLISSTGKRKWVMRDGEQKGIHGDRAILVPGPSNEVRWVRRIYDMYLHGSGPTAIARYLNERRVRFLNGKWDYSAVVRMLRNPNYAGCSVWGKTSGKLRSRRLHLPRKQWLVKPHAFPAVIGQDTFDRVKRLWTIRKMKHTYSDSELIRKLQRLLKRKGSLDERLINKAPGPKSNTYIRHFGGLPQAYKLIGYTIPKRSGRIAEGRKRAVAVREAVLNRVLSLFPHNVSTRCLPRKFRHLLLLDGTIWVSVVMCQPYRTRRGLREWIMKPIKAERQFPCLVCLLNEANDAVEKFYLLPNLRAIRRGQKYRYFAANDPLLSSGTTIHDLSHFYAAVIQMNAQLFSSAKQTGNAALVSRS